MAYPDWAHLSGDGKLTIDWEEANQHALAFDRGARGTNASLGKMLVALQRMSYEQGYTAGVNNKHPDAKMLTMTGGNA